MPDQDCGASYSNVTISGGARSHLGNKYAEMIVNNYGSNGSNKGTET
jgi:hypothetical protein